MYFWCFLWMSSVTTTSYGAARHRCASASVIVCIAIACMGAARLGAGKCMKRLSASAWRGDNVGVVAWSAVCHAHMQFGYFDFLGRKKTSTSLLMHLKIQLAASKNRHCTADSAASTSAHTWGARARAGPSRRAGWMTSPEMGAQT